MSEKPFWTPSEAEVQAAQLTKFRHFVNERHNLSLANYQELWKWSTGSPEEMNDFWTSVWDFTGVVGDKGPAPVSQIFLALVAASTLANAAQRAYLHDDFCSSSMLLYPSTRLDAFAQMLESIGQRTCYWVILWLARKTTLPWSR